MPSVYQQLAQQMQDVSGDKGVLKEVIRPGDGDKVPYDSTVIVKYSGYLEQAEKPFDTNCFRRYPRLMKLGEDITLAGMEIALLTMQRGELSRFLFSPSYAYGTLGCPPLIPRSATVLFEIELLDFLDTAESDSFCSLTLEQQATFPLDKVIKIAGTEREFGNYLFKRNRFDDAKERYKRALTVLARYTSSEEEKRHLNAARLFVYLNLSLTYLKKERPARALIWGEKALDIDSKNTKALYRCGLFEQHSPALNMESESSASSTSISPNSSDNESIVAHMDDMTLLIGPLHRPTSSKDQRESTHEEGDSSPEDSDSSLEDEECFPCDPQGEESEETTDEVEGSENIRVGHTNWCVCGNCEEMPAEEECLCCAELPSVHQHVEVENTCIMINDACRDICLNEERLFLFYRMLGTITSRPPEEIYNRQLRKVAYRAFTCWMHGYLGPRNRRPIPSCVAYLEMREYEKARNFLLRAQKQEPYNLEINSELKRLESCYQDYMDKQREMCCRMFASSKATRH